MNFPKIKPGELYLKKFELNEEYDEKLFPKEISKKTASNVDMYMNIKEENGEAGISIQFNAFKISDDKKIKQQIFSAKIHQEFTIEDLEKVYPPNEKGVITIPADFCNHLSAITIAEARGLITAIPKPKKFYDINIPFFKWKEMFRKDIKLDDEKDEKDEKK